MSGTLKGTLSKGKQALCSTSLNNQIAFRAGHRHGGLVIAWAGSVCNLRWMRCSHLSVSTKGG